MTPSVGIRPTQRDAAASGRNASTVGRRAGSTRVEHRSRTISCETTWTAGLASGQCPFVCRYRRAAPPRAARRRRSRQRAAVERHAEALARATRVGRLRLRTHTIISLDWKSISPLARANRTEAPRRRRTGRVPLSHPRYGPAYDSSCRLGTSRDRRECVLETSRVPVFSFTDQFRCIKRDDLEPCVTTTSCCRRMRCACTSNRSPGCVSTTPRLALSSMSQRASPTSRRPVSIARCC